MYMTLSQGELGIVVTPEEWELRVPLREEV